MFGGIELWLYIPLVGEINPQFTYKWLFYTVSTLYIEEQGLVVFTVLRENHHK
jgi:hypothetical protein